MKAIKELARKIYKKYADIRGDSLKQDRTISSYRVSVILQNNEYSSSQLAKSVLAILRKNDLCSIATIGLDSESYINAAFYCFSDAIDIYFLSDPDTHHCHNMARTSSTAISIFNSHQVWGSTLKGLQLFGNCSLAEGKDEKNAVERYKERFPAYRAFLGMLSPLELQEFKSRFFVFHPITIKIFDESEFGEENIITVKILKALCQ